MTEKLPISIRLKRIWLRLTRWEFWPTAIVYLPVLICYPVWALLSRDVFFFSLVNPRMRMGGLYGASKFEGLFHLNADIKPITILCESGVSIDRVKAEMAAAGISFPLIIKPDLGERGKGVEKVLTEVQLARTLPTQTSAFIIQEYLDFPFEAGVFYVRNPGECRGKITSIVVKGFLSVVGDGVQSIREIIVRNNRALLIWEKLAISLKLDWNSIPNAGEVIVIEPIGNHCRGTAFNNGTHLINDQLQTVFEDIAQQLPEFYYGRFDVRAPSEADFIMGKGIKIMEVNGANAEPAHIYEEGASLVTGIWTLLSYWNRMYRIAKSNRSRFAPSTFHEALYAYRQWQHIKHEKWNQAEPEIDPALT